MGLIEDRHVGRYGDHTIEIIEDGVAKRVSLVIDGSKVSSESCILPQEIVLAGAIEAHAVEARVVTRMLKSSLVTLEIDGAAVPLEKNT